MPKNNKPSKDPWLKGIEERSIGVAKPTIRVPPIPKDKGKRHAKATAVAMVSVRRTEGAEPELAVGLLAHPGAHDVVVIVTLDGTALQNVWDYTLAADYGAFVIPQALS